MLIVLTLSDNTTLYMYVVVCVRREGTTVILHACQNKQYLFIDVSVCFLAVTICNSLSSNNVMSA